MVAESPTGLRLYNNNPPFQIYSEGEKGLFWRRLEGIAGGLLTFSCWPFFFFSCIFFLVLTPSTVESYLRKVPTLKTQSCHIPGCMPAPAYSQPHTHTHTRTHTHTHTDTHTLPFSSANQHSACDSQMPATLDVIRTPTTSPRDQGI